MSDEINLILTKLKLVSESEESCAYVCDKEHSKILYDYITNLKELCDKYEEEHSTSFQGWIFDKRENERLKERCEYLERSNNRREDEIMSLRDECVDGETYKSRNEKAIEYIKQNSKCGGSFIDDKFVIEYIDEIYNGMELLNILNGDE